MKNKKGQLGIDTAKAFLIGLMSLIIIGVVVIIVMVSLADTSLGTSTYTITNESIAFLNGTGVTLATSGWAGFANPVITELLNASSEASFGTGNGTISALGVITNATASMWDEAVLVSYTYDGDNEVGSVSSNATSGLSTFFTSTATWLSLLGIVILILIISVVIATVNRFGGSKTF